MVKTVNLVRSFAEAFSSLETLSAHRNGLDALKEFLTAPSSKELRESLLGDIEMPDIDVENIFERLGDVKVCNIINF